MRDLIFVSLEDWDEVWRRNQFLCAALARRFPEMKILFVGLPRNVSHGLRHGKLAELAEGDADAAGFSEYHSDPRAETFPGLDGCGAAVQ